MAGIPLFLAEPDGTCRLVLRRFRFAGEPGGHRHDASVVIGENEPSTPRDATGVRLGNDDRIPRSDPRWPAACPCGEPFAASDQWQVGEIDWYEGCGRRFAWGRGSWDGPPGAMIRAPWSDERPDNGCPAYIVFLPNGTHWGTRDTASGGGGQWQVTGTPPLITVTPSINDQGSRPWHGWVRNGELVDA